MKRGFLGKLVQRSRKGDFLNDFRDISFTEGRRRRATAYIACFVTIGLTSFAILLNIINDNRVMIVPLCLVIILVGSAVAWLWLKKTTGFGPMYVCMGTLCILGGFLLVTPGSHYDAYLFYWFLLFPQMVMFCLGLRRGSILFCSFLFFLILMLATPLQAFLAGPLSWHLRACFIGTMIGSFVFSCGAEYMRFQTQKTLSLTLARVEIDSLTDSLTGLGNRRNLYNFYNISFLGSSVRKYPFVLAVADIDHFKRVNDTFGHDVGDSVLRHVADVFRSCCRETDKLYRWGGEEFLLLMPFTTASEARLVLERMRHTLEKKTFHTKEGTPIVVTSSFGLYEGTTEKNLDWQINLSDQNLYAAKRTGRNRVVG